MSSETVVYRIAAAVNALNDDTTRCLRISTFIACNVACFDRLRFTVNPWGGVEIALLARALTLNSRLEQLIIYGMYSCSCRPMDASRRLPGLTMSPEDVRVLIEALQVNSSVRTLALQREWTY